MIDKARFKNYGLWISIAALIPLILKSFGVNILQYNYNEIVQAILSIFAVLGILNNPTTECKGFSDDENADTSCKIEAPAVDKDKK